MYGVGLVVSVMHGNHPTRIQENVTDYFSHRLKSALKYTRAGFLLGCILLSFTVRIRHR